MEHYSNLISNFSVNFNISVLLKVKNWVKELRKMLGSEIVLIIAGNKIDLEHERTVPLEEAERYDFFIKNLISISLFS